MSGWTLRDAQAPDLPAIAEIFNQSIRDSTASFRTEPETPESLRSWFEHRDAARHPVLVAQRDTQVLGWASLSPHKPFGGYRHTAELSIYLDEQARARGLGTAMLRELIARARAAGHHTLIGGCCTESEASIRLHLAQGFEKVAHFREVGWKFGRWLDVAYYQLKL